MKAAISILILGLLLFINVDFANAPSSEFVKYWQAKRVVKSRALIQGSAQFRIESVSRINNSTVKVCWSEEPYLPPGRDVGCDKVQRRGTEWWLFDDSVLGAGWGRWL